MRGGVLGKFRQNPVRRPSRMNLVFLSEGGASKIENRDPKTDTFFWPRTFCYPGLSLRLPRPQKKILSHSSLMLRFQPEIGIEEWPQKK